MSEATIAIELDRPLSALEQAGRVITQVQDRRAANSPANEEQPEEVLVILPQEPASVWSTMRGCTLFFFGTFFAVSWGVAGPSMFLGLIFSWPNFAAVVSIIGASAWIFGYLFWYVPKVYYPGRPWEPILCEGSAQLRQTAPALGETEGQTYVYARRECGLPKIWTRSWIPLSEFVVVVDEEVE